MNDNHFSFIENHNSFKMQWDNEEEGKIDVKEDNQQKVEVA